MLKPIKTNQECEQALERVYNLMQKNIKPNSKESDELEILSILIKEYESTVHKLPKANPLLQLSLDLSKKTCPRKI